MAKSKTTTDSVMVAVSTSKAELAAQTEELKNKIPQLVAEQEAYLKTLKGDEKDATVSLDIEYSGTAISSIEKVSELIEIEASIKAREAAYTNVLNSRGLEEKVVAWSHGSHNIEHWSKVLDKAYNKLVNKAEIALVEERLEQLKQHLSEEAKMKATLEKLIQAGTVKLS
jgi:phage shock protein A